MSYVFVYIIETNATEFFVSLSQLCFAYRSDIEEIIKSFRKKQELIFN